MSSNSERFCLKWKNHASNLTRSLIETVTEQCFVDVTLACEDGSLKAHKLVLSTCSLYFKELLKTNPCKHPIVIFKDMKMRDLKAIVDFMYKGEVNISHSQLSTLLKTAETLKVKGLTESNEGTQKDCSDPSREEMEEAERQVSDDNGGAPPTQSTSASAPLARRRKRRKTRKYTHTSIPAIPAQQQVISSSEGEEIIDIIASIKKPVDSGEEAEETSRAPQTSANNEEAGEVSQVYPRIPSPNVVQTRRRAQQSRSGTIENSTQKNDQIQQQPRSTLRRNTHDASFVSENNALMWSRNPQSLTDNEEQFDPTIDRSLALYEEEGDAVTYVDDGSNEYLSLANTSQSASSRVCACHLCHVTFTAYSSLRRHMQRHFADPERYECDICQNRYTRKDYLKRHKLQKHGIR